MENKVRFGPSGNESLFYEEGNEKSTQAPKWLHNKGLTAYEYSFGRGYNMSEETARQIGQQAIENDVLVSVHAPYYVNFANTDESMVEKSFGYILTGLKFAEWFNGQKMCVHLASQGKLSREEALNLTKANFSKCLEKVYENFDMTNKLICPETLGKYLQIGNELEIVDICTLDKCLVPTFDFGHLNCLKQGGLITTDDYKKVFDYAISKLGLERTKNCHIHFSQIQYNEKGEIRHLDFGNGIFGPYFEPLAQVLIEYKLTPTIICESMSHMATDAMKMRDIYNQILISK